MVGLKFTQTYEIKIAISPLEILSNLSKKEERGND